MQLRELIKEIRHRKNWTQAQMAQQLRVSQQNIQGMENAGSNLEKQWAIFLKLTPVCLELGIDPAQDLLPPPTTEEVINDVDSNGKAASGPHGKGKTKIKKKSSGALSAGGIAGGQGKRTGQAYPKFT